MPPPVFFSSGDLLADRRYEYARAMQARGDLAAAADLLVQATERAPHFASAWFALGDVREQLGDRAGAVQAFQQARAADTQDRSGAVVRFARLTDAAVPMPPGYVRTLFDQYAARFDRDLVGGLTYCAPALLRDAVENACAALGRVARFRRALDLGCGTGLAGEAFAPTVDILVGVDLSPGMIAAAQRKSNYDKLLVEDMLVFLSAEAANSADLVFAADALVYCPDLTRLAADASRVLAPGGLFAFTVETHPGAGVILKDTLRYAHSATHVRAALDAAGLALISLESATTRTEKGAPVLGLLAVANAVG